MNVPRIGRLGRRDFLSGVSALAAGTWFGAVRMAAAEPPPETKKLRFLYDPVICVAPMFFAEELLRLEGFSEIEYVNRPVGVTVPNLMVADAADFTTVNAPSLMLALDQNKPIVIVAGVHVGCFELFANERVRAIRDLKGKKIAISMVGSGEHVYISSMLAYVGVDPNRDVEWITAQTIPDAMQTFVSGKADAFLGFPPQPQELRAKKIGHVIVNTTLDRPWSQYFCCLIAARREFAERNPIATKRVVRAILKAADICASEPERVARYLVDRGYTPQYPIALEVVRGLPYTSWREYHPEDTVRFHALRLHEVGMIKTDPKQLVARGTDWRFLNELKKELKA